MVGTSGPPGDSRVDLLVEAGRKGWINQSAGFEVKRNHDVNEHKARK
jgi:hypothetical protein